MMEILTGILNNYIIQVTFASWCTAQVLKTLINAAITKSFKPMGVRRAAGEQAKIINQMVDEWLDKTYWKDKNLPQVKQLKEMLGHTPIEVIGGIIVGVVVSLILL